jgi:XTP/dITP diphosphohydrolase
VTTFVLATANAHKAEELRAVLGELDVRLLARPSGVGDVDETEDTLEGNALLKARALVNATGLAALADDTGLFVDALGGRPGVHSARYAGETATDEDNVAKLLGELSGESSDKRTARFRTVIAVAYPGGESFCVEGVLEGVIAESPRGDGGFGYDPVFIPRDSDGMTLAELSSAQKNAISHRGNALRSLAAALSTK